MATESEAAADDAPGRLRDRLRSFAVNRTNHAIFGVLLLKVASAAVSFLLFSFAARSMGADEFGRFAIWFSVISVLSVVAVFGQELMIVRAWNEHHRDHPGLAKGALIFGFAVTIGLATPVSLAAAGYEIATDGDAALAVGVGMFLLLHTILLFTTHASRAIVGIFNGDTHREITWRVIVIAVLGFALATGALVTTAEFFRLAAAGIACSITIQLLAIHKRLPKAVQDARAQYDAATWLPRSWKMWLSAIMESINQYAEVIVVGWLIHPAAAGAYFVAARLANSFQIAASGINTFGTRHVPRLYYAGETEELARVMRMMAIFTAIIVVGGLVCVLVGGKLMLWIFGAQYMDQYPVLLTLSVGTAAVAAAGTVRRTSKRPTRSSSALIRCDTAEGVMCSAAAALSKLPSRTTAARARNWPWSRFISNA